MVVLAIDDVTVASDKVEAVRGVSLEAQLGQIVTVIGPNGAGKTTLLGVATPLIVREVFKIIPSLRELGVSILLVEQNARAALETADFGYVLETGEIVHSGPSADLVHDPRVVASYLGGPLMNVGDLR